eukprot:scaffold170769_cov28-Tisochrysis_lutea.AAC.10
MQQRPTLKPRGKAFTAGGTDLIIPWRLPRQVFGTDAASWRTRCLMLCIAGSITSDIRVQMPRCR